MKSLSRNMVVSVCARIIALICGLLVQRNILITYGSVYNGLTSSIAQVMSYLALLESGLGAASIQALYKPIASGNWKAASSIFVATGKSYRKVSAIFFTLLLIVSIGLPLLVADEVDYLLAALLTFVTGASSVVAYVVGGKYSTLLSADRHIYVLHAADIGTVILSCALRIMALQCGWNIVFVQTINLLTVGIKNVFYIIYVKQKYKYIDQTAAADYKAISKRWNVLVHSIAGMIVNHTDITILTLFSSLKVVSVYSVYNMVFSQMNMLISSTFIQAPQATFGRLFNQSKVKFKQIFDVYEAVFTATLFALCTITVTMIVPFVRIYTDGVTDIEYIDYFLPILFGSIMLMNQVRVPAMIMVNVAGTFKETQGGAIIECIINITVSLLLYFGFDMGMHGLLLGTVCSYLYRTVELIVYTYKYIIEKRLREFVRLVLINGMLMCVLYTIFQHICFFEVTSFILWIGYSVIISSITVCAFISVNLVFNSSLIRQIRNLI